MDIRVLVTSLSIWFIILSLIPGFASGAWTPFAASVTVFLMVVIPLWVFTIYDDWKENH